MTNYIISRPEKNVNLLFLWDLAESVVEWAMHPWQLEEMDWPFGFDLMMLVVEVIEDMLVDLYKNGKNVNFYWIPWNHDRINKNHQEDQKRTGALVMYEMIKRWLSGYEINIETVKEKTATLYLENFNIVVNHWDEWFDKKAQANAEKILWNNVEKNGKPAIIFYWDKHNVKVSEWKNYTTVWLPALAWKWTYDTRLDLHSEPWFVVAEKNHKWTADISIKRL